MEHWGRFLRKKSGPATFRCQKHHVQRAEMGAWLAAQLCSGTAVANLQGGATPARCVAVRQPVYMAHGHPFIDARTCAYQMPL